MAPTQFSSSQLTLGAEGGEVIAFEGDRLIAAGEIGDVVRQVKAAESRGFAGALLAFDAMTGAPIDFDLRGTADDVVARVRAPLQGSAHTTGHTERGPGRPRLGVVGREVTLLPRHWEWLGTQPGGASAAMRRLVDQARTLNAGRDVIRRAQEHAYRFVSAMMGDQPGFEEATRALFAGDRARFTALSEPWPADPRDHARRLAAAAFTS